MIEIREFSDSEIPQMYPGAVAFTSGDDIDEDIVTIGDVEIALIFGSEIFWTPGVSVTDEQRAQILEWADAPLEDLDDEDDMEVYQRERLLATDETEQLFALFRLVDPRD